MAGRLLGAALVLSLGVRVLYLFVGYLLGWAGTERFRVESWALIFVVVGVALKLSQSRQSPHEPAGAKLATTVPYWLWAVFCALAVRSTGLPSPSDFYPTISCSSPTRPDGTSDLLRPCCSVRYLLSFGRSSSRQEVERRCSIF